MPKHGSPSAWLLVDGYDLRAASIQSAADEVESLTERTNGLGSDAEAHTPVGVSRTTLTTAGGFFDTETHHAHDALSGVTPQGTPSSTPRVVAFGGSGLVAGARFTGCAGMYSHKFSVVSENNALTKANVEYQVAGRHERGQIVQALTPQTGDWDTEAAAVDYTDDPGQRTIPIVANSQANPTVITTAVPHGLTTGQVVVIAGNVDASPTINGAQTVTVISPTTFSVPVNTSGGAAGTGGEIRRASSPAGGAGYLQIVACEGFTNFVGTIRDSADGVTFADLVTFADSVVAPSAQRVEVTGTVDRYLAFSGDVTGTGSIAVFAGFARRRGAA